MSEPIKNPKGLYTTGEIAKLAGVSVRTVQYYDTRGLLIPSELTEGGRRLYTDSDLKKMRIICFLRDLGLSINSIGDLLSEEHPERVIDLLLTEQERDLRMELEERKEKLEKLTFLRREIAGAESFTVESIGDIATVMQNKKKLFKTRAIMIIFAVLAELIEIGTIILWIAKGIWWPFAVGMPVALAICACLTAYYYKQVAYICPACHKIFKPRFWSFFNAFHTPNTRKLVCPACGHKGYCVETHHSAVTEAVKEGKE